MKKLFAFLVLFFITFFPSILASADDLDSQLPIEVQNIFKELDKVSEIDEEGMIYINIDEANRQNLSLEAIEIGIVVNDLSEQIKKNGVENTVNYVYRAAFFGVYGNYCGKGNKGWNVPPVDDLDAACMQHDMCFKGFGKDNKKCNREFCRRLLPIIQVTPPLSHKGMVAIGAYKLFNE